MIRSASSYGTVAWGLALWASLGPLLNPGGPRHIAPLSKNCTSSTGGRAVLSPYGVIVWCVILVL